MLKYIIQLYFRRRAIKKERKVEGECFTCGKSIECEPWCWGPSFWLHVRLGVKAHKWSVIKLLWHNYKNNLKWAGTEPWHRYE